MFGFDVFPIAAASLDMTADFAPLLSGLYGLLGLSTVGIVVSAGVLGRIFYRRPVAIPPVTASSIPATREQAKAA